MKKIVKEKKKKKFNLQITMLTLVIFSIIIIIIILIINYNSIDDTYKVARKITNNLKSEYNNITLVKKEKNKKNKYSYINSTLIYINDVSNQENEQFTIEVSKYNSNAEATKKAKFIKDCNKIAHKKFDNTVVELSQDYDNAYTNDVIIIKGNYLFIINPKIKNQAKLKKQIKNIIKNYNTDDINKINKESLDKYYENEEKKYSNEIDIKYNGIVAMAKSLTLSYIDKLEGCTENTCDELLNNALKLEKYTELSKEINSVKNKYNEIMNRKEEVVNSINSSLEEIKKNLNEEQYDSIKKKISELNDTYYDKYRDNWNSQLSSIEESVYKNSCKKFLYKDLLRNPSDYNGKKAFFLGKILQKVGATQYRVGIDCSRYNYISGYHCDNTIYVTYYGESNLIEDDIVELWGTMDGTQTYTTVMGTSVTIPKFYAKYAAFK